MISVSSLWELHSKAVTGPNFDWDHGIGQNWLLTSCAPFSWPKIALEYILPVWPGAEHLLESSASTAGLKLAAAIFCCQGWAQNRCQHLRLGWPGAVPFFSGKSIVCTCADSANYCVWGISPPWYVLVLISDFSTNLGVSQIWRKTSLASVWTWSADLGIHILGQHISVCILIVCY